MRNIPFLAIGNNELGPEVGKSARCPNCKKHHTVEYGYKILPDGTKEPSRVLGFVKCGKKSFLVAINEKLIKLND